MTPKSFGAPHSSLPSCSSFSDSRFLFLLLFSILFRLSPRSFPHTSPWIFCRLSSWPGTIADVLRQRTRSGTRLKQVLSAMTSKFFLAIATFFSRVSYLFSIIVTILRFSHLKRVFMSFLYREEERERDVFFLQVHTRSFKVSSYFLLSLIFLTMYRLNLDFLPSYKQDAMLEKGRRKEYQ